MGQTLVTTMKSCGISFDNIFSLENLLFSHLECRKNKQHKKEVIAFELNLATNLAKLKNELDTQRYFLPKYRSFYVYEPKKRLIEALSYKHRVVQRCLCEFCLKPVLDKTFIFDSAACRVGKGSHFGLGRLKLFLRKFYKQHKKPPVALVLDMKKYFPSINHEVLKQKFQKYGFDKKTMRVINLYIDSACAGAEAGLPIGNQTSQWMALTYLDEIDKLIKHKLKRKFYLRYMDDLIVLGESKSDLLDVKQQITKKANEIKLTIKMKRFFYDAATGIPFCGFVFYCREDGTVKRLIKKKTYIRAKRNIALVKFLCDNGFLPPEAYQVRKSCLKAHLHYSDRVNSLK